MNEDLIPEVNEFLPGVEGLLPHSIERQHRLDLGAIPSPQRRKTQFSGVPRENDPPRDPDEFTRGGVRFKGAMGGTDVGNLVGDG